MPGCNQTLSGLARDCQPNKGGIKEVLITYWDAIASVTITDGKVSAITFANELAPDYFKKYVLRKGMGSMTKTLHKTDGGNTYVTVVINMNWPRMETTKRAEAAALALNECMCIVKDANGIYWLVGYSEPVTSQDGAESTTGAANSDTNQYGVQLGCDEDTYPYEVPANLIDSLLGEEEQEEEEQVQQ